MNDKNKKQPLNEALDRANSLRPQKIDGGQLSVGGGGKLKPKPTTKPTTTSKDKGK